jgi:hypothetical protein
MLPDLPYRDTCNVRTREEDDMPDPNDIVKTGMAKEGADDTVPATAEPREEGPGELGKIGLPEEGPNDIIKTGLSGGGT